jgi:hypothetical protein
MKKTEIHSSNRSPELDSVVAKHEKPVVRLPHRLPSRPLSSTVVVLSSRGGFEEDENEDEGMWDRNFVKTTLNKSNSKKKSESKKLGKGVKAADEKNALLQTA